MEGMANLTQRISIRVFYSCGRRVIAGLRCLLDLLPRLVALPWLGCGVLRQAAAASVASAALGLTCASAAAAGTVHLTAVRAGQVYLVTASGTYTEFPSEIDVYVHRGGGACSGTDEGEKNVVEQQVRTLGIYSAGVPVEAELGTNLMMSGSYSQRFYWGVDAPADTYMACAYLLGPQPGPPPQSAPPFGQPADPPQATASAQMALGSRPGCAPGGRINRRLRMRRDGSDIRDNSVTVVAGQAIHLSVVGRCSKTQTAVWSIQGATRGAGTSAIANYTFADAHASVEYLRLPKLPKTFYFIRPGKGGYRVTAKVPGEGSVTRRFRVKGLDTAVFTARTCNVRIDNEFAVPVLMFSGVPGSACGYGVAWTIGLRAPAESGGEVGITQIISDEVKHDDKPCSEGGILLNAGEPRFSDGGSIYHGPQGASIGLAAGGPGGTEGFDPFLFEDSPRTPLAQDGTWFQHFKAVDYLMFRPTGIDSVWVALRQLEWSWSGTANVTAGKGSLDAHSGTELATIRSSRASTQPTWNKEEVPGEFKCP